MSSEKKPQPVAWRADHKYGVITEDCAVAEKWKGDDVPVMPLYSEATIEALRAERDGLLHQCGVNLKHYETEKEMRRVAEARVAQLEAALGWYGKKARLCRLIHSEGDVGRYALSEDGGRRARALLSDGGRG